MLIEVKVPELSESVAEATLLAWHKKVGEAVKRDENLIDIETDKVVLELPAPADGVLAKIIRADGGTVKAGEIIATIDTEGKAAASAVVPAKPVPEGFNRGAVTQPSAQAPAASAKPAPAMPAARKIAEEKGIDTGAIAGSGRGGRVTKADVLAQAPRTSVPAQAGTQPAGAPVAAKPALTPVPAPVSADQVLAGRPARPGRAGRARRGPDDVFRHRKENRRFRQARPGRQAHDRGADRRHFLDLERRGVRLDALHPHHQPAAIGDPGRARDARAARGRERPGRDPADQLPRAFLRSPHHRRPRGGAVARGDQGSARRSRAVAVRSLRPEPGRFYAQ